MTYRTPQALRAALADRAKHRAPALGVTSGDLVQRWYYQRLLARVFHHDPAGWLLKGGQALLVRFDHTARHSRDIDLYRPAALNLDQAERALIAAAETTLDDYLRFVFRSRRQRIDGAATVQITFDVYLGGTQVESLHVDVVVDLAPIGTPSVRKLEPSITTDWPADWPHVQIYPIVDHLADKVLAMYERHGTEQAPSSRFRDLVDIVLIALRETIDGKQLRTAIRSEHHRRVTLGTTVHLPNTFVVPDRATWAAGYAKAAKDVPGLEHYRTLDDAAALADVFLSPVLASEPVAMGIWLFTEQRWKA